MARSEQKELEEVQLRGPTMGGRLNKTESLQRDRIALGGQVIHDASTAIDSNTSFLFIAEQTRTLLNGNQVK